MVINITLGFARLRFVMLDCGTGFAGVVLAEGACANAEHPADRVKAAANGRADKKVEKRPNMRLLWRRLLPRAPRLLVGLRRESFGGQRLG